MRIASTASTDSTSSIISDYNETDVHLFFSSLGLPQYESHVHEHGITGDVLASLDHEGLREMGITSVGQRLTILKAVYNVKIRDGVPISPDDYVPPSEVVDPAAEKLTLQKLYDQIVAQERRIQALEFENQTLNETMQRVADELNVSSDRRDRDAAPATSLTKQPSFRWKEYKHRSPTRQEHLSPGNSPMADQHDLPSQGAVKPKETTPDRQTTSAPKEISVAVPPPKIPISAAVSTPATATSSKSRSNGGIADATDIRSFKVSLDDPAWKVLPAALKKYKINNDDWQNYAMFICFGNTERCLSYDEKPLLLFQKLKDAKKNPVFMLKHIRDIRSPIAVAQQKQAARSKDKGGPTTINPLAKTSAGAAATAAKASKMAPITTAGLGTWPDIMSPITGSADTGAIGAVVTPPAGDKSHGYADGINGDASHGGAAQPLANVSYAVAIYPYHAEQEDEFDVGVNDTFIIVSRARGWWVVQRDPQGTGQLDPDISKQGWVPAGCLLETSQPVALAIQDTVATRNVSDSSTPIMPSNIISTSYPGIALMDYRKKGGEEELDLVKDDTLRVYKRYNHWSYAVKEVNGERGWVPSWFIGKIGGSSSSGGSSGVPQTPAVPMTSALHTGGSGGLETTELRYALDGHAASPISPGFGNLQTSVTQTRSTATMI